MNFQLTLSYFVRNAPSRLPSDGAEPRLRIRSGWQGQCRRPAVRSVRAIRQVGGAITLKSCGRCRLARSLISYLMLRGHCHDSETRKNCEEFSLLAACCALAGLPSANVIDHIHTCKLVKVVHARDATLQVVQV